MTIASTSRSVRVWSASIFRNTSPTRRVARSLWAASRRCWRTCRGRLRQLTGEPYDPVASTL